VIGSARISAWVYASWEQNYNGVSTSELVDITSHTLCCGEAAEEVTSADAHVSATSRVEPSRGMRFSRCMHCVVQADLWGVA